MTGKIRHKTSEIAEGHAIRLFMRGDTSDPNRMRIGVYQCHFCDGYHVGHRAKKHK